MSKIPGIGLLVMLSITLLLVFPSLVLAQGGEDDPISVLVTTQDYASFRGGPGLNFPRSTVIPPAVDMVAIGRSADTRWVQVGYQGQIGWVYAGLLVWVGDIVQLPVDGIAPQPFVRRMLVRGVTTRDTPLYEREVTPEDQVGTLPPEVEVEVTGRLGGPRGMYQLQIRHEGRLYWVGSWNIRILDGAETRLLDTSYLYAYGRLTEALDEDIYTTFRRLENIQFIWQRLQAGDSIRCIVPAYARRKATDFDVNAEPVFAPLITALDAGIMHTNAAISSFDDACNRADDPDFALTEREVNAALDEVEAARRNLNIARSLLASLEVRDPLLGDSNR